MAQRRPTVLRAAPRVARPLTGRGALPSEASLLRRTPQELVHLLGRFNIAPDLAAIAARVDTSFQRLDALLEQGLKPDASTWKAMGEQLERAGTGELRRMAKAAIRLYKEARRREVARYATWVTSGGDSCPSCEPRHGQTRTWAAWDKAGRPGSAALICSAECNCQLVPDPAAQAQPERRSRGRVPGRAA